MKKLINKIKYIVSFDDKYNISIVSSSISFYIVVAIFSLLSLAIQVYNSLFSQTNNFIINYFNEILNPYYNEHFSSFISVLSLNSFSTVLIISLFWSSSRLIDNYNRAADLIYIEHKARKGLINRLNSFVMFLMILCILIFEIVLAITTTNWLKENINNYIFFRVLQTFIEFTVVFLVVLILNIYVPPTPMTVKKSIAGTIFATISLFIVSFVILFTIKIYQRFNMAFGLVSVIALLFIWIFLINYVILIGIIINYLLDKKRKNVI